MTQPYAPSPYSAPQSLLSREDENQLDQLSLLFYIYGGFFAFIGVIALGFTLLPAVFIPAGAQGEVESWLVGGVFLVIFGGVTLLVWGKAVLIVLAGRGFAQRKSHMLCTVAACLTLMNFPLGTALGVFALTVLDRPQVKARFVG